MSFKYSRKVPIANIDWNNKIFLACFFKHSKINANVALKLLSFSQKKSTFAETFSSFISSSYVHINVAKRCHLSKIVYWCLLSCRLLLCHAWRLFLHCCMPPGCFQCIHIDMKRTSKQFELMRILQLAYNNRKVGSEK